MNEVFNEYLIQSNIRETEWDKFEPHQRGVKRRNSKSGEWSS